MNECPEITVDCIYNEFGCPAMFKRKDEKMHMECCLAIHLDLVKSSHKDLSKRVNKLESKVERMAKKHKREYIDLLDRICDLEVAMDMDLCSDTEEVLNVQSK